MSQLKQQTGLHVVSALVCTEEGGSTLGLHLFIRLRARMEFLRGAAVFLFNPSRRPVLLDFVATGLRMTGMSGTHIIET